MRVQAVAGSWLYAAGDNTTAVIFTKDLESRYILGEVTSSISNRGGLC